MSGRGAMELTARSPMWTNLERRWARELQRTVIFKGPDDLVSSLQNVVYENQTRLGGLM